MRSDSPSVTVQMSSRQHRQGRIQGRIETAALSRTDTSIGWRTLSNVPIQGEIVMLNLLRFRSVAD